MIRVWPQYAPQIRRAGQTDLLKFQLAVGRADVVSIFGVDAVGADGRLVAAFWQCGLEHGRLFVDQR
jgi:hypothetical protein